MGYLELTFWAIFLDRLPGTIALFRSLNFEASPFLLVFSPVPDRLINYFSDSSIY